MIHPNISGTKGSRSELWLQSSPFDCLSVLQSLNSGYIERDADIQLLNALKAKQFCAVFAPPHSGKSSLHQQISAQLTADNIVCLTIDLAKATQELSNMDYGDSSRWFHQENNETHVTSNDSGEMAEDNPYGHVILSELWHSITDLQPDHLPFWLSPHPPSSILPQLDQLIEEILLVHCEQRPVVIFVDGLDAHLADNTSVRELLALIRRCYNRRSRDPIYQKLTFCLLGNAQPDRLVQDDRDNLGHSPFSVCQYIELQGFTAEQATPFLQILTNVIANPSLALRLIVQLTGGQPLLTHQLCHLVRTQALTLADSYTFDLNSIPGIAQKYMTDTSHFQRVRDRLLQTGSLLPDCLARYQCLLLEGESSITESAIDSAVATELRLSGLVRQDDNHLAIASPIYQDMFDRQWLLNMLNQYQPESPHHHADVETNQGSTALFHSLSNSNC